MGLMKRFTLAVLVVAILVVPGAGLAKGPKAPTSPKKCVAHAVSYRVAGNLESGALTLNSDGTYSGSLVVDVKKTNRHAKADKGTTVTYTLTSAKLKLHGEDPSALTANSRVKLKGTITTLAKKCDQTGFTPTVTIVRGTVKPPKA
jgi:hypothetical protein